MGAFFCVGESAEAPPAAEEVRRFRGSVPTAGRGSGWEPADTTVSAGEHAKKITTQMGGDFWSGRRGSLAALPRRDTHTGTKTCPRHVFLAALVPFRASARSVPKKNRTTQRVVLFFFGAGDEARTRYLDLGKVALYQMSYARKRKVDYSV